jgi:type II secretory pathway pseudopilin PulG
MKNPIPAAAGIGFFAGGNPMKERRLIFIPKADHKLRQATAMTLLELLVAASLVGIIMVGVVSVDYAIRKHRQNSERDTVATMTGQALMTAIANDAMKAVGDPLGPGVVIGDDGFQEHSFCFRHDVSGTPSSYVDDQWVCYYHGSSFEYHRCVGTDPANIPPLGNVGLCNNWGTLPPENETDFGVQIIDNTTVTLVNHPVTGRFEYIDVSFTINALNDRTQPEHPINNPYHTFATRISPLGISR